MGIPEGYPEYVLHQMVTVMSGGRRGEDLQARGQLRHGARPGRRSRARRGALLLPDAQGRLAAHLRRRPGALAVGGESGLLHPDGARAHVAASSASAGSIRRPIDRRAASTSSLLAEPEEQELIKALLDFPGARRRRGRGARAAPRRDLSPRDGAARRTLWYHKHHVLERAARPRSPRARLVLRAPSQIVLRNGTGAARHHRARADVIARLRRAPLVTSDSDLRTRLHVRSRRRLRRARLGRDARSARADDVLGGSATFFSASASHLTPGAARRRGGQRLSASSSSTPLAERGVDLAGLERAEGESLPLARPLPPRPQLAPRRSRRTSASSRTSGRRSRRSSAARRSSSSATSIRGCSSTCCDRSSKPKLVACDTMNFWIESRRPRAARAARARRPDHAQRRRGAPAHRGAQPRARRRAGSWSTGPRTSSSRRASTARSCSRRDAIFFAPAYPLEDGVRPHRRRRLVRRRLHGLPGAHAAT